MSLIGNFTSNNDRTAQLSGFSGVGSGHYQHHETQPESYPLQDRQTSLTNNKVSDGDSEESGETAIPPGLDETDHRVTQLARRLTRQSSRAVSQHGAQSQAYDDDDQFLIEKGTELDPFSDSFNVKAWTRKIVGITSRDPVNHPQRTSGIAMRDLHVYGYGSDTGFQQTVGNALLGAVGSVKEMFGGGKRRVDILNGFDILLESRDMLVVLGPPGS
jgi:ATP-binding cassette subfamily G (WHITE) protein 2 (PDR)